MNDQLQISHHDMEMAVKRGEATPLGPAITWLIRYRDSWWVVYEAGWLKVRDELTVADLDHTAARLHPEERSETR